MDSRQVLGQRVLLRRRALGMTQQELADQSKCRYQVISRLERGLQSIYADRLAAVARTLQVSADYLLGLTDREEPYEGGRYVQATVP